MIIDVRLGSKNASGEYNKNCHNYEEQFYLDPLRKGYKLRNEKY